MEELENLSTENIKFDSKEAFAELGNLFDTPSLEKEEDTDIVKPTKTVDEQDLENEFKLDKETEEKILQPTKPVKKEVEKEDNDESPWTTLGDAFKGNFLEDSDFETEGFKFDGTKESFLEMLERKSFKKAESYLDEIIEDMPSKLKTQVKSFIEGLDEDSALSYADEISLYENVTRESLTEDPDKAKAIYLKTLLNKGFTKEKADKYVKRAEDLDELTDEALDGAEEMVKKLNEDKTNKAKANEEASKAFQVKAKEDLEKLKVDIMGRSELIAGLPTSDIIKKKVYENMTNIVGKDANGKPMTKLQSIASRNPKDFAILLNTLEVLGVIDIDKNGKFSPKLDKLTTYKKSDIIDNITEKAKSAASKFKGGRASGEINTTDVTSAIKSIKEAFSSSDT